jgi:hypothetical protein
METLSIQIDNGDADSGLGVNQVACIQNRAASVTRT